MTFDRRTFVGGMAAAAWLRSASTEAQVRRLRVGVIGGGIIGASIAANLAKAGADVILFEKTRPAAGATEKSVAWINPVVNDAHYMRLRLESMRAWREDDQALSMGVVWGGSINWAYEDKAAELQKRAALLEKTDDPPRYMTRQEITNDNPGIFLDRDVKLAFKTIKDGHVDPVHATRRYLTVAESHGARIIYPCEVSTIKMRAGVIAGVSTTRGDFDLDQIVCAAGTDTPKIMALVERKLTLAHKPGLVVHTEPRPLVTKALYEASSMLEFKQFADGRFLTSLTGGPPNKPQHVEVLKNEIAEMDEATQQHHAEMLIERTARYLPTMAGVKPEKVLLGYRPYPLDNRPIAGPVPGVRGMYVAVTHSGITLAPILGRYAAQEIIAGDDAPLLAPYRADRYIAA